MFAIVLLRLAIGWHFFGEGTKKVEFDRHDRQFHLVFSADDFLAQAKGPLADVYLGQMPGEHDWRKLLATPRENVKPTPEQTAEQVNWAREYSKRRAEAKKKGEPEAVEFPPTAAYHDWAKKIAADWRATVDNVKAIPGLADAEKQKAELALSARLDELADYLSGEAEGITGYRHDVWRLKNWRDSPEAGGVPFYETRIAAKASETAGQLKTWLEQVRTFETNLNGDLNAVLTPEQREQPATAAALDKALTDAQQARLNTVNMAVTILTIAVGACLLLGFFTRLASLAGALFLLSVIASQPFWVSGAAPTINQCVEFAGLLVLAGTGAGRWAGVDGCLGALFGRRRNLAVQEI